MPLGRRCAKARETVRGKFVSLSFQDLILTLHRYWSAQGCVLVQPYDLEMGAVVKNFGIGEACVLALEAGVDMLAICADADRINEGFDAVKEAVATGRISWERLDHSLDRIFRSKSLIKEPLPFNSQRIAELSDTVAQMNNELN